MELPTIEETVPLVEELAIEGDDPGFGDLFTARESDAHLATVESVEAVAAVASESRELIAEQAARFKRCTRNWRDPEVNRRDCNSNSENSN